MSEYQKQVNKDHYSFSKYYYPGRWMSYWHEVNELLSRSDISSVLDVGPGSDLLRNILSSFNPALRYETLDLAADIKPDHVGTITNIPLSDDSYDAVTAFQVLEHIKYQDVETALQELKRVSNKYVIISLPHFGTPVSFQIRLPLLPVWRIAYTIPRYKKHTFAGQHYWELGKRGYSVRKFRTLLEKHFMILSEFTPFENQYHRFFVLEV